jgi:capsular exopolysaccharide synthesis family protein
VLEVMNTSIRRAQEVTEALNIPSLGVIPRATSGEVTDGRSRFGNLFGARARASLPSTVDAPTELPSIGGEAYRILRTNLLFSSDTQGLRTLVVTSALPQEGKTVIAANLAISFAREGIRVLLIDADLRRPAMHRLFGVARSPGLAQALANSATVESSIRATSVSGLSILACGSLPTNPTELIRGTRMRELLETIGASYDLVIIDTPPVLPVADAAIIAAVSDGVLMVVRAGKTSRTLTQEACARLAAVGANLVGTVLNDPSGRNVSSYSYRSDDAATGAGTPAHA